ncbi:MAG TPA: PEP/pyruvate-binding domain-containing protein, partial [Anaerolineales bacterium]|nr:PEP/pyruvate-binding domain-containing protein [Anaerolineales bacterium]
MTLPRIPIDNVLRILLALSQYPILSNRIRHQMRKALYSRGIVRKEVFEEEVKRKAVESQVLEGIKDPLTEESNEVWTMRLTRVKDSLTDFYFASNLPFSEFEGLVRQVLAERGSIDADFVWANPELAPQDLLFEQAEMIENMPDAEKEKYEARLQAIIAVLIRTTISDQLKYIKIARQWFTVEDLREISRRKIGGGKIGGKAAGMLLAMRILKETAPTQIRDRFRLPISFYLGSDVYYNFMSLNDLGGWNGQKYKTEEQMRADYPELCEDFYKGQFPPEVIESLERVLEEAGERPLIVR